MPKKKERKHATQGRDGRIGACHYYVGRSVFFFHAECFLFVGACHYYVQRSGRRLTFEWAPIAARSDAVAFLLCSCLRTLCALFF